MLRLQTRLGAASLPFYVTHILPSWVVEKTVLVGRCAAGEACGVLRRRFPGWPAYAAGAASWVNPFTHERFMAGNTCARGVRGVAVVRWCAGRFARSPRPAGVVAGRVGDGGRGSVVHVVAMAR